MVGVSLDLVSTRGRTAAICRVFGVIIAARRHAFDEKGRTSRRKLAENIYITLIIGFISWFGGCTGLMSSRPTSASSMESGSSTSSSSASEVHTSSPAHAPRFLRRRRC